MGITDADVKVLQDHARNIRRNVVKMIAEAGSGHPGGSLGAADIATTLYFNEMNINPEEPKMAGRDRFVLSKGHCAPLLYAVLAERGYIPTDELMTLRQLGSRLQGHPDMKKMPGVEISSGSLGQGLSVGNGMAMAAKMANEDYRVYVLMGDGEIQEGQVWEAAMTAPHYKLDNVCAIVDNNGLQIDGNVEDVMSPYPIGEKFAAFGWHVIEVDGHDVAALDAAFEEAKATKGKPSVLVAKTVKGKGVSFMENVAGFHGKAPSADEREQALSELV